MRLYHALAPGVNCCRMAHVMMTALGAAMLAAAAPDVTPPFRRLQPALVDEVRWVRLGAGIPTALALNASATVAAVGTSQRLILVDAEKGEETGRISGLPVESLAFGRGEILAVGLKDGQVRLLTGAGFENARSLKVGGGPLRAVILSPSGRLLAAADQTSVVLLDVAGGAVIGRMGRGANPGNELSMTFDRAERRLIFIGNEGLVGLMDAADGRELQAPTRPAGLPEQQTLARVALDPAGQRAVYWRERVWLMDPARVEQRLGLTLDNDVPAGLKFVDDGATLVGHSRRQLRLWNAVNGHVERVLWVRSESLEIVASAQDAGRLAAVGRKVGPASEMVLRIFGIRVDRTPRPGELGVRLEGAPEGARVTALMVDTAAARADLRENDLLTAIDGRKVASAEAAAEQIRALKEGTTVALEIVREGKPMKLTATLGGLIE
jgi:hypothetical protein